MLHQLLLLWGTCPQSCSVRWRSRVLLMGSKRQCSVGGSGSRKWVGHLWSHIVSGWVEVWEWIWQGCFNTHRCAVCFSVRKTSNRIKSPLDCDLFFSSIWKLLYYIASWFTASTTHGITVDGWLWYVHPVLQLPLKCSSGQKAQGQEYLDMC